MQTLTYISFFPVRKRQSKISATMAAKAPTTRTIVTNVFMMEADMSPAVYSGTYAMFSPVAIFLFVSVRDRETFDRIRIGGIKGTDKNG